MSMSSHYRSFRRVRALTASACAVAALLAPIAPAVLAQSEEGVEEAAPALKPIVLVAPYRPAYRIVAPSTDPEPSAPAPVVAGFTALRGTVVHGEADVVYLDLGGGLAPVPVRLPEGSRLPGWAIPYGSNVEAMGTPTESGLLESLMATIRLPGTE